MCVEAWASGGKQERELIVIIVDPCIRKPQNIVMEKLLHVNILYALINHHFIFVWMCVYNPVVQTIASVED